MTDPPRPGTAPARQAAPLSAADLPIDADGRIYHLQLKPGQIAPDILLVGDPGRAGFIGSHLLRDIEVAQEHRGLVTVTGTAEITGRRATVVSRLRTTAATSGMGTPSLEIVLNELVALHEIDFATRRPRTDRPPLHVIRVGTSGALQADTPLGTPIVTTYAVGMDNTGLFYEAPCPDATCARLERELAEAVLAATPEGSRFRGRIKPYVSRAHPAVTEALLRAADSLGLRARPGLTLSNSGFFAHHGRDVSRLPPSVPDLDLVLAAFDPRLDGQRMENMEMEASFLCHFLGGLGHRAGVVCPAIANRRAETFDHDYPDAVERATRMALLALADLRAASRPQP
jgi:uridine phosphorylase